MCIVLDLDGDRLHVQCRRTYSSFVSKGANQVNLAETKLQPKLLELDIFFTARSYQYRICQQSISGSICLCFISLFQIM